MIYSWIQGLIDSSLEYTNSDLVFCIAGFFVVMMFVFSIDCLFRAFGSLFKK